MVEIQLQIDPPKRDVWPVYATGMRRRLRCPAAVVVIAPDRRVARWCAEPIDVGWGRCVQTPWVIGPDEIPVIDDLERARAAPELAVLSVAAHADEPVGPSIALAAAEAARELDDDRARLYIDVVFGLLGPRGRSLVEQLMSTAQRQFYSEIFQEHFDRGFAEGEARGKAEGEAKGKAELLLKLLALKGLAVTDDDRRRILACTDPELLDTWAGRVLTATDVRDVLGDA
ncbi:MAG TPA: hypothetical protein VIK91_19695 [Nannocystis sp.]